MFNTKAQFQQFALSLPILLAATSCHAVDRAHEDSAHENNAHEDNAHEVVVHQGICDASGVVDLDEGRFAVADDELNMLLVYEAHGSGEAIYKTEISRFLEVVKKPKKKKAPKEGKPAKKAKQDASQEPRPPKVMEVDIEGATRVGKTVYWIASHGRKKTGKQADERMRFFATSIISEGSRLELAPQGEPYDELVEDLLEDSRYAQLGLSAASEKAPKEVGGLNIEALTDRADGALLIGFRSPLIEGKALAAPLLNPHEIVEGEDAKFGDPILVDLGGNGFRGLASHEGDFLIAANDPEGDDHSPKLFRWDGATSQVLPIDSLAFGDFNPEAVAVLPDFKGGQVLMLSDDGVRPLGPEQCPCKDLKDHSQRQFRSVTIKYSEIRDLSPNSGKRLRIY